MLTFFALSQYRRVSESLLASATVPVDQRLGMSRSTDHCNAIVTSAQNLRLRTKDTPWSTILTTPLVHSTEPVCPIRGIASLNEFMPAAIQIIHFDRLFCFWRLVCTTLVHRIARRDEYFFHENHVSSLSVEHDWVNLD